MVTYKISNMRCVHCQNRIKTALDKENIQAEVNLEEKTVIVADDKKEAVAQILDDLGFDVIPD